MTPEEKARLSARMKGSQNPWWGKQTKHGPRTHWVSYHGVKLRSSYELRFAKALDAHGLKWEYEPRRFDLGLWTFLPDFFLPETGAYWEVKGWFDPKSQKKVQLFRERYPEIPLVIADNEVITMMEV